MSPENHEEIIVKTKFLDRNLNHLIEKCITITEKDDTNDNRGAGKVQSKTISSHAAFSLAAAKSDHLSKLNLDTGSMVEVKIVFFMFSNISLSTAQ